MSEENKHRRLMLESIEQKDAATFLKAANRLHYADLATIYEALGESERDFFAEHLDTEQFAEVITDLPDTLVEETMERLDTDEQREVLEQVSDDDRVDLLQDVSDDARERLLELVEPDDIEVTKSLLKYGEDTAGGRMTTHFGSIRAEMTIEEALLSLKEFCEETESFSRVYVVDAKDKLCGFVRFRDLAFNTRDTKIADIQRPVTRTILSSADQEEAAQMVSKYDLFVLPVIDEQNRILGIITHDDVVEILEEESTEDMEKMAGFTGEGSEETYLNTPTRTHFKRRFPWLFGLAILAIASGIVMIRFEQVLKDFYLLTLFLPMVVAAGGNTGGQASTMVIRAMALGELDKSSTLQVMWKELRLGIMLGSLLGIGMAVITLIFVPIFYTTPLPGNITFLKFAMAVAIALAVQITSSTLVGSLLPIAARAAKIDPAVVAAPAITTIVDVSGMAIYFFVAINILGL